MCRPEVLERARARFRCISYSCLTQDDFSTSLGTTDLSRFAELGSLGGVDAFISYARTAR